MYLCVFFLNSFAGRERDTVYWSDLNFVDPGGKISIWVGREIHWGHILKTGAL